MANRHKLLLRTWLTGPGCVHRLSPDMDKKEARDLLDKAKVQIDAAQDSDKIQEIKLPPGKARAFLKAHRSPDPNQLTRMAPGFILISIPDPLAFLQEAVESDFEKLLDTAVNQALDASLSDQSTKDWKTLDLAATPHSSLKESAPSSSKWWPLSLRGLVTSFVFLVAIGIIGIGIIGSYWFTRGKVSTVEVVVNEQENPKIEESSYKSSRWNALQPQIVELLNEEWARKILGNPTVNFDKSTDNHKLLDSFARLFVRPSFDKMEMGYFKTYDSEVQENHPLVTFVKRFPTSSPRPEDNTEILLSEGAYTSLETILQKLGPKITVDLKTVGILKEKVKEHFKYGPYLKQVNGSKDPKKILDEEWAKKLLALIKQTYPEY